VNDLALGIIVLTIAAVPLSLLVLGFTDVVRLPDVESRHRWINRCLVALAVPALLVLGVLVWGWSGAAHLGPLCAAYATPEYRHERPLTLRSLLVDSDQDLEPPWAAALLQTGGGPLEFIEYAPRSAGPPLAGTSEAPHASAEIPSGGSVSMTGPVTLDSMVIVPPAVQSAYRLEARRRTHHRNRWFTVEMDRFRLIDRSTAAILAEGDEMWIRAGRAIYHCGIGSGTEPTAETDWPAGTGVRRFLEPLARTRSRRTTD
jgi:hypothetical protein